jgi:L-alanine-DL-glutamate epimerase-like enolase superfamily enzyme
MRNRPVVFVRVEDGDGQTGWGEVWCNFPSVGAEHRTRLITELLAPMLVARSGAHPSDAFEHLDAATSVLVLQSGEPGPFAQTIAGIDIALWDLFAKRASTPLWRMLGGTSGRMRVYASGINPTGRVDQAQAAMQRGHRAFKLKIGFDADRGPRQPWRSAAAVFWSPMSTKAGESSRRCNWRRRCSNSTWRGCKSRCAPTGPGANGGPCKNTSRFPWPAARTSRAARISRRR